MKHLPKTGASLKDSTFPEKVFHESNNIGA